MKFVCAPMATLSHEAFRILIENFGGCDEYFTEMINAPSLLNRGPFEKFYLLNGPAPEKIVWQLTGSETKPLAEAACIVCEKGGIGVDLNMGCSAPQIYKTGAGISWMLKPLEETKKTVRAVKDSLNLMEQKMNRHFRLSVKCRLGDENFTEAGFLSFTDMLVENGVELITLHPRTIKEKYRGLPRYEFVHKISQRYKDVAQVYLNGCIKDFESESYALQKCPGADGVMIARAAAEKPWIFRQIQKNHEHSAEEISVDRMKTALDFIDYVEKFQPKEFHKTRIQRFFSYYCKQFEFGHYFQTGMTNYKSNDESRKTVIDYFSRQPHEQFLTI
ncbi:tRNA-dihydrouridine synthase family protein [Treponema sp.]|uniref:tRNA-dihydrouridine synthase family protein n=1 Tax=Treponema sp. TaxID=166 RepID=UPI003F12809A